MTTFKKIDDADRDPDRVTLTLFPEDDQKWGMVDGPVRSEGTALLADFMDHVPAPGAVKEAVARAKRYSLDAVDVIDPDHLWEPEWGVLKPAEP